MGKLLLEQDTKDFSQIGHKIFIPFCGGSKEFWISSDSNKMKYQSPLLSGIVVLHPALVGAGEPERPGTKVAD